MPQQLLTFCLGAMYNTLPSPSNLHHWHINPEASCLLCKKQVCTTAHVLGACTVALRQGRFTFRHDSVLSVLVVALESFLSSKKCINAQSNNSIKFVKAGAKSGFPQLLETPQISSIFIFLLESPRKTCKSMISSSIFFFKVHNIFP